MGMTGASELNDDFNNAVGKIYNNLDRVGLSRTTPLAIF